MSFPLSWIDIPLQYVYTNTLTARDGLEIALTECLSLSVPNLSF